MRRHRAPFVLPLLGSARRDKSAARRRRGSAPSINLEVLENRTPLSAGPVTVPDAPTLSPPTELRSFTAALSDVALPSATGVAAGGDFFIRRAFEIFESASFTDPAGAHQGGYSLVVNMNTTDSKPAFGPVAVVPPPWSPPGNTSEDGEPARGGGGLVSEDAIDGGEPAVQDFPFLMMSVPPMIAASWPRVLAVPTADGDTAFGALALDESMGALTESTSLSASTVHFDPSTIPSVAMGRSAAFNQTNQADQPAWASYLAGGTSDGSIAESMVVSGSDIVGLNNEGDSSGPLASLVDGEAPIGLLLSGPQAPDRASSESQEQVAELVPLSDSSLALAGTLWSVSAESAPSADSPDQGADSASELSSSQAATAPQTAFLMGLDQSIRQTAVDLRAETLAGTMFVAQDGSGSAAGERSIQWTGPILPGASGMSRPATRTTWPKRFRAITPSTTSRATLQSPSAQSRSKDVEPARSENDRPLVLGTLPLASAISASTFIAGWIWRIRKQGLRAGRTDERALNGKSQSST
jgi:hypothetical protein